MRNATTLAVLLLCALGSACDDTSGTGGSGTASSTVGTTSSTVASSTAATGTGGAGGFPEYVPTPADIEFQAVNPLPSGDYLLINDWDTSPNSVVALSMDGVTTTEIFRAYRVWSMGLSHDGKTLAFASGDPHQDEHFGINVGDAIQHTFAYDVATQQASLLAHGNINDECHTFSPNDDAVYVCRRSDFQANGQSKTYRLGKITIATKAFDWITGESESAAALHPQPTPDGLGLLYTNVPLPTGPRSILSRPFAGIESLQHAMASAPLLDAAGARYLYQDASDMGALHEVGLDGTNDVVVAMERSSQAVRSFDGQDVYFLVYDDANACSSIDRAKVDGSEAAIPERVYDCATEGRFITELAFVHKL